MNPPRTAATAVLVVILTGCGSGQPSPSTTATDSSRCPSVGQIVDRYIARLKAGDPHPQMDFTGCTPDQMQQRIADMQLLTTPDPSESPK